MRIDDFLTENEITELRKKTLSSYVSKRLARNPNLMSAPAIGKTKKQKSGVELAMDKMIPGSAIRKPRVEPQENVEVIPEADATDTVTMDVPLLIRIMEYAREDAKTDMDLHDVAEKLIELSKHHDYLCMDNYNEIVGVSEDAWDDYKYKSNMDDQNRYNARMAARDREQVQPPMKITPATGSNPKEKTENALVAGLNNLSDEDKKRFSGASFSASGLDDIYTIGDDGTIYLAPAPKGNLSNASYEEEIRNVKYILNLGGSPGTKVILLYTDVNYNLRDLRTKQIIVPSERKPEVDKKAKQEKQGLLDKIKSAMFNFTKNYIDPDVKMRESNAFTDARMNAIKAGKKSFSVGGKTYPITGDTSDEREAIANEDIEESCPHCGGLMLPETRLNEKKDACYYKVKSRYKVWPSAYASGALVKCRKAGAKNWGNKSK